MVLGRLGEVWSMEAVRVVPLENDRRSGSAAASAMPLLVVSICALLVGMLLAAAPALASTRDIQATDSGAKPTCVMVPFCYSDNYLEYMFEYDSGDLAQNRSMSVALWSSANGQDDLRWTDGFFPGSWSRAGQVYNMAQTENTGDHGGLDSYLHMHTYIFGNDFPSGAWWDTIDFFPRVQITYDANGGAGAPDATSKYMGSSATVSTTRPTRTGYTFKGWAIDNPRSSVVQIDPGQRIGYFDWNTVSTDYSGLYKIWQPVPSFYAKPNGSSSNTIPLYAVWEGNTYYIYYNPGTATGGWDAGAYAAQSRTFPNGATVRVNNMTHSNTNLGRISFNPNGGSCSTQSAYAYTVYTANGWTTSSGSSRRDYASGQANVGADSTAAITLYPCFSQTARSPSFPTPTRTGYAFGGWYTTASASSGTKVESYAKAADITLYAHWIPKDYYVTFNGNGATSGSMARQKMTYDHPAALDANAYSKAGYVFAGWSTSPSPRGNDAIYLNRSVYAVPARDVTMYARWMLRTYTISYDLGGGKLVSLPGSYNINDAVTIGSPSKTGYKFIGWSGTGLVGNGNQTVRFSHGTGARSYKANWQALDYAVKFDPNGGTGVMQNMSYSYDSTYTLPPNAFDRRGYRFAGWNSAADGSGTPYADAAQVMNLSASGSVTLYAQWEGFPQTVTFVGAGITVKSEQVPYGGAATPPAANKVPTPLGQVFSHWDRDFSCVQEDLTVNAVYRNATFDVDFIDHDGTVLRHEVVEYGKAATAPESPYWDGHVFRGWDCAFSVIYRNTEVRAVYDASDFLLTYYIRESDADGGVLGWTVVAVSSDSKIGFEHIPPVALNDGWAVEGYFVDGNLYTAAALADFVPAHSFRIEVRLRPDVLGNGERPDDITSPDGIDDRLQYVITYACGEPSASMSFSQIVARTDRPIGNAVPGMTMYPGWLVSSYTVEGVVYSPPQFSQMRFASDIVAIISVFPDALGNSNAAHPEDLENNIVSPDGVDDRLQAVVSFVSRGSVYNQQVVMKGSSAAYPVQPSLEGFSFRGWQGSVSNIREPVSIYAIWEASVHTVTYVVDGEVVGSERVPYGQDARQMPEVAPKPYYEFVGWGEGIRNVTEDRIVTARFERAKITISYSVRGGDEDGLALTFPASTSNCAEPVSPTAVPEPILSDGWVFDGFYVGGQKVPDDLEGVVTERDFPVEARAYPDKVGLSSDRMSTDVPDGVDDRSQARVAYSVEPDDAGGLSFIAAVVERGKSIGAENVPELSLPEGWFAAKVLDGAGVEYDRHAIAGLAATDSMRFAFRSYPDTLGNSMPGDPSNAANSVDFADGIDDRGQFLVIFRDDDASVVNQQVVAFGQPATPPAMHDKGNKVFSAWSADISSVTSNLEAKAIYIAKTFKVRFYTDERVLLSEQDIPAGDDALAPTAPEKAGYMFTGWDRAFTNVLGNLDVTATYDRRLVELVFYVRDGDDGISIGHSSYMVGLGSRIGEANIPEPVLAAGWAFDGYYIGQERYDKAALAEHEPVTATAVELRGYPDGTVSSEMDGVDDRLQSTVRFRLAAGTPSDVELSVDRVSVDKSKPLGRSNLPAVSSRGGSWVIEGFRLADANGQELPGQKDVISARTLAKRYHAHDACYIVDVRNVEDEPPISMGAD